MVDKTRARGRRLTRGVVAEQTGVNIETVRYYERIGLLPEPPRSVGGHRLYDEDLLRRLNFIRRSRELGFTLDEVRGLLRLVYPSTRIAPIATLCIYLVEQRM